MADKLLCSLVVLLLVPASTHAMPAEDPAPHEPIVIEGDADLLVPDALSDNGVRGGTGLREDPWRITDWTIDVAFGEPAVAIFDVRSHILVERLVIRGVEPSSIAVFVLQDSPNVTIREVTSDHDAPFMEAYEAGVVVENVHIQGDTLQSCVAVEGSHLSFVGVEITGMCGIALLRAERSVIRWENVTATRVANVAFNVDRTELDLRSSTFVRPTSLDVPERWGDLIRPVTSGLEVILGQDAALEAHDLTMQGFPRQCILLRSHEDRPGEGRVVLSGLELTSCGTIGGPGASAIRVDLERGGTVQIEDSRIGGTSNCIWVEKGHAVVERSLLHDCPVGVRSGSLAERWLGPGASVDVRNSTIAATESAAHANKDGHVTLSRSWRTGDLVGDVREVDPANEPPVAAPDVIRSSPSAAWLVLFASALALLVRGRQPSPGGRRREGR